MKKIISGKKYDTDKSTLLGSWENDHKAKIVDYRAASLYKSTKGTMYLVTFGMDDFNNWFETEPSINQRLRFIPFTLREAKAWAEEYLDADEYESIFGEVTEA